MGKVGKVLFQDELEEIVKSVKSVSHLFGEEPAEKKDHLHHHQKGPRSSMLLRELKLLARCLETKGKNNHMPDLSLALHLKSMMTTNLLKAKSLSQPRKSNALNSGRLQTLASKPECKCTLDALIKQTFL